MLPLLYNRVSQIQLFSKHFFRKMIEFELSQEKHEKTLIYQIKSIKINLNKTEITTRKEKDNHELYPQNLSLSAQWDCQLK